MNRIAVLKNPILHYDWGSESAIPQLLGEPNPEKRPMAEMWIGAHPKAPSQVIFRGKLRGLDEVIEKNPRNMLGAKIAKKYFNKLPFLLKLLAAAQPLSLQVHPNRRQAHHGFEKENRLGIPLNAPGRNYKDNNHKPELLCALTPFEALKGFRRTGEILMLLGQLSIDALKGPLAALRRLPPQDGVKQLFTTLMTMDREAQRRVVSEAVDRAASLTSESPFHWMLKLHDLYPGDIGVLLSVILNLVRLEPGQAIFLRPGQLHSYLEGFGVELMANSDNVLRGGLTSKHVDAEALTKTVSFEPDECGIVKPFRIGNLEKLYPTGAEEFLLSEISLDWTDAYVSLPDRSVEVLLCTQGEAAIVDLARHESLDLSQGMAVIIPASVTSYRLNGRATFFKAFVPSDGKKGHLAI